VGYKVKLALLSILTVMVVGYVALSGEVASQENNIVPLDVGTRKQLLFDDALTTSKVGFVTTMNPAPRFGGPVLVPDQPWEEARLSTGQSIIEDAGIYKMWYTSRDKKRNWYLCYATSEDGVHWVKPNLGIIKWEGNSQNNIVFAGTDRITYAGQFNVFKDPNESGSKKFKLSHTSNLKDQRELAALPEVFTWDYSDAELHKSRSFISAAYSPDGLHWTPGKSARVIDWYSDTQDVAFWDDRIQKYVLFVRWNHEELDRCIGRSESLDFDHFPKPELVLTPDALDPIITGLYNSAAMKYPYAERAYFLFPSAFYHSKGDVKGGADGSEAQVATSRDGVHFLRPWRKAFLGVGLEGSVDASQVYLGTGMICRGDEFYLYYTGYKPLHHDSETMLPRTGGIGMVRIRLDGFVSQDAPPTSSQDSAGGVLTTIPLKFSGNHLEVNFDAGAGGWLKVEILDGHGRALPGYGLAEAGLLLGNSVRKKVTWQGKSDLSPVQGKVVQIRFTGRSVKLYAFQFSE